MHDSDVPGWAVERGKLLNDFPTIDPARSALLVVDMQNYFILEGQDAANTYARDILPNLNRVVAAFRAAGGRVIFLRHGFSDEGSAALPAWQRDSTMMALSRAQLLPGTFGHALHAGLDRAESDWIIDKYRYSAFVAGSSDLAERLACTGIDMLIVTGTLTNVCCESTTRDAVMLGYKVVLVTDATAAVSDAEHNAALLNLRIGFADLKTADEAIAAIVARSDAAGAT